MQLVPASVTRSLGRHILKTKKNSPHIFFAAGIVGFVGTTILASKATLKLEKTVDEIQTDLKEVKAMGRPSESGGTLEQYPDRQYYLDLGYVYGRSALKVGKLYGPTIVLGVASIGALTGSHVQMTRRNSALTATLALVSKAYDDYREQIRKEIGEARESDIYRGIEDKTETIDGKKKVVKRVVSPNGYSVYAKVFDEFNVNYKPDAELNRNFLTCQMNYFNYQLQSRGHVFLNEVYDHLGMERTKAGAIVGWVFGKGGDDYVDFGMFEENSKDFINGIEPSIWLDFNVDGVIYELIEEL